MLLRDIIQETIPPLKATESGLKALQWMQEFKVGHMPVVDGDEYLGLIAEEDILDLGTPDQTLGGHELRLTRPILYDHQHIYDAIRMVAGLGLTIAPIIDKNEHFVGVITLEEMVKHMSEMIAISDPGGIIVFEMSINDYSLAKIAHIAEENDTKVISAYVSTIQGNTSLMELTIKVNKENIQPLLQSYERFGYDVVASFQEKEHLDDLKDRFESFMKFINI